MKTVKEDVMSNQKISLDKISMKGFVIIKGEPARISNKIGKRRNFFTGTWRCATQVIVDIARTSPDVFTSECLEKARLSEYLTRHYTSLISFREPPRYLIIPSFAISRETATEAELARNGKREKKLKGRRRRSDVESRNRRSRGGRLLKDFLRGKRQARFCGRRRDATGKLNEYG